MPGPYMAVCTQTPRHSPIHRAKNSAAVAAATTMVAAVVETEAAAAASSPLRWWSCWCLLPWEAEGIPTVQSCLW